MNVPSRPSFSNLPNDQPRSQLSIDQWLRQSQHQLVSEWFEEFTPETLAWLAIAPVWPESLARGCKFPTPPGLDIADAVERMIGAGVAERDLPLYGEPGFRYAEPTRQRILQQLRDRGELPEYVRQVRDAVRRGLETEKDLPEVLSRWIQLAEDTELDEITSTGEMSYLDTGSSLLIDQVMSSVNSSRTGEAQAWVKTAESFAPLVGPEFNSNVRLARRRLEWGYRCFDDQLHLRDFMPRAEQIAAFERLLEDDDCWALHFLGVGGVGKTMLLRYLTGDMAPKRGFSISRIDFDFLSPDYPLRRPGQLLLELGDDLSLQIRTSRAETLDERFRRRIQGMHDILESRTLVEDNPLHAIRSRDFKDALQAFAEFLSRLPQPVVLMLDTCEELAKLHPDIGFQPAVQATFEILEAIKHTTSQLTLRVVFAGRRPLAKSGAGWRVRGGDYLIDDKPYLALHLIQGFTKAETHYFFRECRQISPPDAWCEIAFQHSIVQEKESRIEWTDDVDGSERCEPEQPRYSPFDIALYADWYREDPEMSAKDITWGSTDPYIEMRIIHRIKHEAVLRALPLVILLRRFERRLFELLFDADSETVGTVFKELRQQEWIWVHHEQNQEYLEVDRHLHQRLHAYFSQPNRGICAIRERVTRTLRDHLQDRKIGLRNINKVYIDVALRLSATEDAVSLWWNIHDRIPCEADWSWAANVTDFLLRDIRATDSAEQPPVTAAVRATRVFALRHTQPSFDVTDLWHSVEQMACRDPELPRYRELERRAILGQIASRGTHKRSLAEDAIAKCQNIPAPLFAPLESLDQPAVSDEDRVRQLAGSMLSAVQGLVQAFEQIGPSAPAAGLALRLLQESLSLIERVSCRESCDSASVLHAALWYRLRNVAADIAKEILRDGEALDAAAEVWLSKSLTQPPSARAWEDLTIPIRVMEQFRCAAFFIGSPRAVEQVKSWQSEAEQQLQSLDARYLASLSLQVRFLLNDLPSETQLDELRQRLSNVTQRPEPIEEPRAYRPVLYDALPPLWSGVAVTFAALGLYSNACQYILDCIDNPAGFDRGDIQIDWGLHAFYSIARQMRSPRFLRQISSRQRCPLRRRTRAERIRTQFLLGESTDVPVDQEDYAYGIIQHALWQVQRGPDDTAIAGIDEHLIVWEREFRGRVTCSIAEHDALMLDAVECWYGQKSLESATAEGDSLETTINHWATRLHVALTTGIEAGYAESRIVDLGLEACSRVRLSHSPDAETLRLHVGTLAPWNASTDYSPPEFWRAHTSILIDEAELVLHRLPERAVVMLMRAYELCETNASAQNAFRSAALLALAQAHAGNLEASRDCVRTKVSTAYALLQQAIGQVTLPPFDALLTSPVALLDVEPLRDHDLQSWFVMVSVLHRWLDGPSGNEAEQARWVEETQGLDVAGFPELDFSGVQVQASPLPPLTKIWRILKRPLTSDTTVAMLWLFVAAAFWVGIFYGFWWGVEKVVPTASELNLPPRIGIFVGGLCGLGGFGLLIPLLNRLLAHYFCEASRITIRFSCENPAGSHVTDRLLKSELTGRFDLVVRPARFFSPRNLVAAAFRLESPYPIRTAQGEWNCDLRESGPYVDRTPALAEAINGVSGYRDILRALNRLDGRNRFTVRIDATPETCDYPWEGVLFAYLGSLTRKPENAGQESVSQRPSSATITRSPLIFVRHYPHLTVRQSFKTVSKDSNHGRRVAVLADNRWTEALQSVWSSAGWKVADESVRVVHIIGDPVQTRTGVRLDGPTLTWQAALAKGAREGTQSDSRAYLQGTLGVGELASADSKFLTLSRATGLVIIQQTPSSASGERTDSDRRLVAELRQFCHSLMMEGAPNVLMIPALDTKTVNSAFPGAIRKISAWRSFDGDWLLDVVAELRQNIRESAARQRMADLSEPAKATPADISTKETDSIAEESLFEVLADITLFSRESVGDRRHD